MSQEKPNPDPKPETIENPPTPPIDPDGPTPGILPPPFREVNYNEGPKVIIEDSCFEIKEGNLGGVYERDLS